MAHLSFLSNLFICLVLCFSTYKLGTETTWTVGLFYLSSALLIIMCVEYELSCRREDELKSLLKKNNIDFYDEDEETVKAMQETVDRLKEMKEMRKKLKKNKEASKVEDDKVTSTSEETKPSE